MGLDHSRDNLIYSRQYGSHQLTDKGVVKLYQLTSGNLLTLYGSLDVPTILPILHSERLNEKEGIMYGWKLTFKHLTLCLEEEIQQMIAHKRRYSEEQILKVMDCVLSALMGFKLKLKKLTHGNVNCQTILIDYSPGSDRDQGERDQNKKVYALGLPLILNVSDTEQLIRDKNYDKMHLSPFSLLQLSQGKTKLSSSEKNDVFALGIVVLRLATLCTVAQLYDYERFKVKDSLNRRIYECRSMYSMAFCNMIEYMTARTENKRPDFQQLFDCFSLMTNYDQPPEPLEGSLFKSNFKNQNPTPQKQFSSNRKEQTNFKPISLNNSKKKNYESMELFDKKQKPMPVQVFASSPQLTRSFIVTKQSQLAWSKFKNRMQNKTARNFISNGGPIPQF